MSVRKIAMLLFIICTAGIALSAAVILDKETEGPDTVAINEMVKTIEANWTYMDQRNNLFLEELSVSMGVQFAVIDNSGEVVYQSADGISTTVYAAIKNRDIVMDVTRQGEIAGKIILHNKNQDIIGQMKRELLLTLAILFVILLLLTTSYVYYLDRTIFKPFNKLQSFAMHVARGNLNIPLHMDKKNLFGAFTESFDIMREELAEARRSEYEANRSKKELVASLSHDIKTPVASIKAVSELMLLKETDEKTVMRLNTIQAKAEQVNHLVTDMFHATLEELQQLKVNVAEEESGVLAEMIENVNYDGQIDCGPIPACIILTDVLRLRQVLDNILSNSYKYAGTPVAISSRIDSDYLMLRIDDYGKGVDEQELPLLFQKFYRGRNAAGLSGSGLGLYLSHYFMENMQGDMECRNRGDGFTVTLKIKLA